MSNDSSDHSLDVRVVDDDDDRGLCDHVPMQRRITIGSSNDDATARRGSQQGEQYSYVDRFSVFSRVDFLVCLFQPLKTMSIRFLRVFSFFCSFDSPFSLSLQVEVCGFKDCRRSGGGARLEKLVQEVLEEKSLATTTTVEGCDCQGECGYGPNLLVDGKIVNGVRGREAVLQALGIQE